MLPGILALAFSTALAPRAGAVDVTGLKGLGGSGGTGWIVGDWEFRQNSRPRFSGDAIFKYGISPRWVLATMFGFQWTSYDSEESWLSDLELLREIGYGDETLEKTATLAPFTVGVEYRFGTGERVPYVGAGGGVYMKQMLFNRSVALDPRNFARHRTYDLGFYGRVGIEQFVSDVVSVDYDALYHVVFSEDRERFPLPNGSDTARFGRDFKGYGGDVQALQVRIGVRYYWGGGL